MRCMEVSLNFSRHPPPPRHHVSHYGLSAGLHRDGGHPRQATAIWSRGSVADPRFWRRTGAPRIGNEPRGPDPGDNSGQAWHTTRRMMERAMPPSRRLIGLLPMIALLLGLARPAAAVSVTYSANLSTSKGNPVTHLLIIESDGAHPVQASAYPADVPGRGTAVIRHDTPYPPARSLLVGLTEGQDQNGADKTQLVMFLDPGFAAAHAGEPFSTAFPGVRHSETIAQLTAAVAGDTAALAWFTDAFFAGSANAATFATGGAFVVAEFTSLKTIGQNATDGPWMVTSFQSLPGNDPDAQSGRVTAAIDETAQGGRGPFDIQMSVDGDGVFAVDKTVLNDTGMPWSEFVLELGTGVGAAFVPSTMGDGLAFAAAENNREDSGAFPTVEITEDRIRFRGLLPPGESARFVVFVQSNTTADHLVTLRQRAPQTAAARAPVLGGGALGALAGGLAMLGMRRLRRRAAQA